MVRRNKPIKPAAGMLRIKVHPGTFGDTKLERNWRIEHDLKNQKL